MDDSEYKLVFPWWFNWYFAGCKFFANLMQINYQMDVRTDWVYRQAMLKAKLVHKSKTKTR